MYPDHPQKVPTLTSVSSKSYSRPTEWGVNNSETMPKLTSGRFVGGQDTWCASYCPLFCRNERTEEDKNGVQSAKHEGDDGKRGKIARDWAAER